MKRLNKEKLEKTLRERLDRERREYRVSAAHILVLQDGQEVCSICEGYPNWDTKEPLRQDAMYRLASMTSELHGIYFLYF